MNETTARPDKIDDMRELCTFLIGEAAKHGGIIEDVTLRWQRQQEDGVAFWNNDEKGTFTYSRSKTIEGLKDRIAELEYKVLVLGNGKEKIDNLADSGTISAGKE
jgi:hypothetical protein